jgi:hypothetical protein
MGAAGPWRARERSALPLGAGTTAAAGASAAAAAARAIAPVSALTLLLAHATTSSAQSRCGRAMAVGFLCFRQDFVDPHLPRMKKGLSSAQENAKETM